MRRSLLVLGLLVVFGCATRQPMTGQAAPDVDRKLSTFAYIEEGKLATFIVDTRPTRYRENEKYIPVEVAIAKDGAAIEQPAATKWSDAHAKLLDAKGPVKLVGK